MRPSSPRSAISSKAAATGGRPAPLEVQVDPVELILHDNAETITTHLEKDQQSFSEQIPAPEVRKPEEEFGLLNVLAKVVEALNKVDPAKPEGVVLRAMAKNFITPETATALMSGMPIQPTKPEEFQTPQFRQAMNALNQKYRDDPPRRDALGCVAAAARGRPLTGTDVFHVFRNLGDGMQLNPEQWQQVIQNLVQAVQLMKKDGDDWNRRMAEQGKPSVLDLANMVREGTVVNADGTLAPRGGLPLVHKPDETMGLLEMYRDFWLALFKAGQNPKLRDDVQRQMAELLRHTGQKFVRTGRTASMSNAMPVDAKANRYLIQKLRSSPSLKADEAKMAALEKLARAEATGRSPSPQELLEIFEALGHGVQLTPDMLRAVLEYMIGQMRAVRSKPQEIPGLPNLLASRGPISPVDAVRVLNNANVQKPQETAACLELFVNFFLAMRAANQNAALRDHYQRMMADTLQDAAQLHAGAAAQQAQPVNVDAYRMKLMKLRADPTVRADQAKARAVEELVAAQATGKRLSQPQMLEIFQDLARGVKLTPEMLRIILEQMCNRMRTLTPNEKAELQKRFRQNPARDPTDFVDEAARVRQEQEEIAKQAQVVGCFQVFPAGHQGFGNRPVPTTKAREVGMRAGPATIDWHRYQALGIQPPEEEMARIVLVQSQLADVKNFEDEKTQRTLMGEAADVSFRTILQPSVMEKYKESLRSDTMALSALHSLSQVGTMDDRQLGKRVDQLLTTLNIDRPKLRNVLQQMVRDRLMTNDEAKDVERRCEMLMAAGGGKMKLSDLQTMLRGRRAAR